MRELSNGWGCRSPFSLCTPTQHVQRISWRCNKQAHLPAPAGNQLPVGTCMAFCRFALSRKNITTVRISQCSGNTVTSLGQTMLIYSMWTNSILQTSSTLPAKAKTNKPLQIGRAARCPKETARTNCLNLVYEHFFWLRDLWCCHARVCANMSHRNATGRHR